MSQFMVKFMILFAQPDQQDEFENIYNDFFALVERMPDITRRQVIDILGSPVGETGLFRILEVYFEDRPTMEAALRTKAGQEAGAELRRFKPGTFEMVFADVYEEEGGATADPKQTGS
ncbi:MAG: hypothetical protein CL610_21950 [Anaerolineaceae bacterium]|nr:hypothetical protein [Anaerolineaceae bacterium]